MTCFVPESFRGIGTLSSDPSFLRANTKSCLTHVGTEGGGRNCTYMLVRPAMNLEREETLIRAFFRREQQQRWLTMLRKRRKRSQVLDALNHSPPLDGRYCIEVESCAEARIQLLKLGAPKTCYAMSDIEHIDGHVLPLADALSALEDGEWGTILDCVPGELAYYFGERGEQRLVLSRKAR